MTDNAYDEALARARQLLGQPFALPLGPGEPESGNEFRRLATVHTFGDSWSRTQQLDTRTRSLISVAIAAALRTHEPLRGRKTHLQSDHPQLLDQLQREDIAGWVEIVE